MVEFEGIERRIEKINAFLKDRGISSLEEAREICLSHNIDPEKIVRGVQPIAFDNAVWGYTVGIAAAIKGKAPNAVKAAVAIGQGLQSFTVPGSVADER
ncbi:MAG: GGGtGRT protein, partial [Oscillospiraceae bacterium]